MSTGLSDFYRGDTKTYQFQFTNEAGVAVDITDHELWITLKSDRADLDVDAALQKKVIFPGNVDSQNGQGVLVLESTDTDSIVPGQYWYDFQKVIPGAVPEVVTLVLGQVKVLADVTRSIA